MILDLYFEEGVVCFVREKGREKMNWLLGCCNFVLVLLHVMKYLKF